MSSKLSFAGPDHNQDRQIRATFLKQSFQDIGVPKLLELGNEGDVAWVQRAETETRACLVRATG